MPVTETIYLKGLKTQKMFEKGKDFLGASLLLKDKSGQTAIQIHLFLQGVEIILKALLVMKDYDKYYPLLRKYGHNLARLVKEAKLLYNINHLDPKFEESILDIGNLYRESNLRYVGIFDLFIDIDTLDITLIEKKTYQLLKYLYEKKKSSSLNT